MRLLRRVGLVRQVVEHVREAQQPQRLAMGADHFEITRHGLDGTVTTHECRYAAARP